MKCPNCGKELEEGKLLCENCGYEVKIVPDYDIELEDKLKESISSMMEDMAGETMDDSGFDDDIKDSISDYFPNKVIHLSKIKKVVIALAVLFVMAGGIAAFMIHMVDDYRYNSFEYQYDMAVMCAATSSRYHTPLPSGT